MCLQLYLVLELYSLTVTQAIAYTSSCQVQPTEYAYHKQATGTGGGEAATAMCTVYPEGLANDTESDVDLSERYTHCNGTQLRLTDSELGPEKSINYSLYYEWGKGTTQLLFIFSTRVNLTTITLHYYSGGQYSLPSLTFYAVPDNFYVWNNATFGNYTFVTLTSEPQADLGSKSRRNVSVNVNFNTKKVLMVKERSGFNFAVSEVESFTRCNDFSSDSDELLKAITTSSVSVVPTTSSITVLPTISSTIRVLPTTITTSSPITTSDYGMNSSQGSMNAVIIAGLITVLLVFLTVAVVVPLVIWRRKRNKKLKLDSKLKRENFKENSVLYSTLYRGDGSTKPGLVQQHPLNDNAPDGHYDKIELTMNSSIGQESQSQKQNKVEATRIVQPQSPDDGPYGLYDEIRLSSSSVTSQKQKEVEAMHTVQPQSPDDRPYGLYDEIRLSSSSVTSQKQKEVEAMHTVQPQSPDDSYGLYDEIRLSSSSVTGQGNQRQKQTGLEEKSSVADKLSNKCAEKEKEETEEQGEKPENLEEMYADVNKTKTKTKEREDTSDEEKAPTVPEHTEESLYTALKKSPID